MNWVAIDFETANTSRNSACALGAAFVSNGRIIRTASWLIRPPSMMFDPYNIAIHGIKPQDVADSPTFDLVWDELEPMLDGVPVIAHNASFDFSVLRSSMDEYGIVYPELDYYCTLKFSQAVWPERGAHKLNLMADLLGIQFKHHDAEADAIVCAQVAAECCRRTGAPDLPTLAAHHSIKTGKLFPGGYTPCSLRRKKTPKRRPAAR